MFSENSVLVKTWVKLVRDKDSGYSRQQVPNLLNLREMVFSVLDAEGE